MNQIQIWQLVVDLGLVASVLVMSARAFKSSRLPSMLPQTRELESSLRILISEAERSGQNLNEQLIHREQNIQRHLASIQESETRITKALVDAETLHSKLQTTRAETIKLIQEVKSGLEQGVQTEQSRYEAEAMPQQVVRSQRIVSESVIAPASSSRIEVRDEASTFSQSTYAEPLTASEPQPHALRRERAVAESPRSNATGYDLKKVYQAAEAMIKQGQKIEQVAAQTKIPLEGVRLLAEMIEIEREEDTRQRESSVKIPAADSRLGALGEIRRQTSVL